MDKSPEIALDPLVRLHGIDENHAGEVAEPLAYFRSLQQLADAATGLTMDGSTRLTAGGK